MTPSPTLVHLIIEFFKKWSSMFKIALIGLLALFLLIPLGMLDSLLDERLTRRDQAIQEITSAWGEEQTVIGPILIVPYEYISKVWKNEEVSGKAVQKEVLQKNIENAYFLPSQVSIQGAIKTQKLYKGIYDTAVYRGEIILEGSFDSIDLNFIKKDSVKPLWEEAVLTVAASDLRGTTGQLKLMLSGQEYDFYPSSKLPGYSSGVHALIKDGQRLKVKSDFRVSLDLNGSKSIYFLPIGKETTARLNSPWPDPGFRGAFLPQQRMISKDGFDATWNVSFYGRSFSQSWATSAETPKGNIISESLFGVEFVNLIDSYRNVERSIKYGILFILLIFTGFWVFEHLTQIRIHPLQYVMVGIGLCFFYLVLLSMSEFLRFGYSYLIAATVTILMMGAYCSAILKSTQRGAKIGLLMGSVYTLLYFTLQLQDYSLLLGTAGLLIALSIMMFYTRKLNN